MKQIRVITLVCLAAVWPSRQRCSDILGSGILFWNEAIGIPVP